jgi:hypothetical protein
MKKDKNNKEYRTLLSVLAHGATDDAQKILIENNIPEATTYEELEFNLAKIYKNSNDKIGLEKHFAEIHPHSKFILKYLAPKKEEVKVESEQPKIVEVAPIIENKSNAIGDSTNRLVTPNFNELALVSIVAIVGLVIIAKKI